MDSSISTILALKEAATARLQALTNEIEVVSTELKAYDLVLQKLSVAMPRGAVIEVGTRVAVPDGALEVEFHGRLIRFRTLAQAGIFAVRRMPEPFSSVDIRKFISGLSDEAKTWVESRDSSGFSVLVNKLLSDGVLELVSRGEGTRPNLYRRVPGKLPEEGVIQSFR